MSWNESAVVPVAAGRFVSRTGPASRSAFSRRALPEKADKTRARLPLPILMLVLTLPLPWMLQLGTVMLPPYRVVILIFFIPCLIKLVTGRIGRIRVADIALALFCIWCTISIVVIHGWSSAVQPAGIIFIETLGSFLMARCYIRSAVDFYRLARLLFLMVLCLLPFALFETISGRNIFRETLAAILPSYADVTMPPRWGLRRVQMGFNHPILYGVFISSVLGITHMVLGHGDRVTRRWVRSATVVLTASLCFSAGAISGIAGQLLLIVWNRVLRQVQARWIILGTIITVLAITGELLANRSLPAVFISYFAFDEASAYIRILTWQYGTGSIANHPWFGVGFGRWDHPAWLTSSVDMFWIVDSLRHGLPAGILLALAFVSALVTVIRTRVEDERVGAYRLGYVISMACFFLSGWTVYYWNNVYVLFMLMLGSGLWIADTAIQPASGRGDQLRARRPAQVNRRAPGRPIRVER